VNLERIIADRGYRGHNAPSTHRFKVYLSGQKRRVTEQINRELRRRSAVEPVIGHVKSDHRISRNYLAGRAGDADTGQEPTTYRCCASEKFVERFS
jgi:IS5 family transposase